MTERLQELTAILKARFPEAQVSLDVFGRTGAVVNVVLRDELYEMEWREAEGFGVTHVTEDKYFTRGSDVGFDDMAEAEQYLMARLWEIA